MSKTLQLIFPLRHCRYKAESDICEEGQDPLLVADVLHLGLLENIRIGWKALTCTNTLAYFGLTACDKESTSKLDQYLEVRPGT